MSDVAVDPAQVPVYPVVRVTLREADGEAEFEGLIGDEVVASGGDVEVVRASVMKLVADRASRREGSLQAVRVAATDLGGTVWQLVVTGDGQVLDAPEPGKGGGSPRRWWVLIPAAVIVVAVAVLATVVLSRGGSNAPTRAGATARASQTSPTPTPTQLPVVGPPGWSAQAAWSVNLGDTAMTGDRAALGVDKSRVYAAGDSQVAAYAQRTGQQVWSTDVDGSVVVGPAVTRVDGNGAVVAATSSTLYAWSPRTGHRIGKWDLPKTGATVTITPTGPLVSTGGHHARIVVGQKLVSRVLPADATAVAPGTAGSLIAAADPGQVWSVGSNQVAGSAFALKAPKKTTFARVVGWSGNRLVAAYEPKSDKQQGSVILRAFTAGSWEPQWTSERVPAARDAQDLMTTAPGAGWGVYGSTVVDLSSGATHSLPGDWKTASMGPSLGFGTAGGQVLTITPAGLSQGSTSATKHGNGSEAEALPIAPQAAAAGHAFLIASDGQTQHLYALHPEAAEATETPTKASAARTGEPTAKSGKNTDKAAQHEAAEPKPTTGAKK